jgi:hypothetical protein
LNFDSFMKYLFALTYAESPFCDISRKFQHLVSFCLLNDTIDVL